MENQIYKLVIGQIKNPTGFVQSNQFEIYTLYNNYIIDENKIFGFASFADPIGVSNTGTKI